MDSGVFTVFEICAGGGGQALGLDLAGFEVAAAAEIEPHACATLRQNRPHWNVIETDIREINGRDYRGITLFAGGVPCPPFSIAGKQLGQDDERDLFPEALRLIEESKPVAIMLENVRGFASEKFSDYRRHIFEKLASLGYQSAWQVLNASDYGVPQLRPRFVLVAVKTKYSDYFSWPQPVKAVPTVADSISDLIFSRGWQGGMDWIRRAQRVAPTIVGGSKKHGGPDLGPTRAKKQWAEMGIDGGGIANEPPAADLPKEFMPKLTVQMVSRIQGFPDTWKFSGGKTASYRQVGNAFPPPVAMAVGCQIFSALNGEKRQSVAKGQRSIFGPFEPISVVDEPIAASC